MGFFNFFKNNKKEKSLSIKARYDAAVTDRNNCRRWAWADFASADTDANATARKEIRIRARYEFQNNSLCHGIVDTLAQDLVGTGIKLQLVNGGKKSSKIEQDFANWCDSIRLAEKLRTARVQKIVDGEAVLLLTTNPKIKNAVKLDLQLIDTDRLTSTALSTHDYTDGILLDDFGNPVSYEVLGAHPCESIVTESNTIPSKYIIHIFNQNRPGQHRGVSELAPCLELFAQLRDYTVATLTAAQTAAQLTGCIQTDAPAGGESADIEPLEDIELENGKLLTMPSGWKLAMTTPTQPTSTFTAFHAELLGQIARSLCVPYNIAAGNSNNASYASSRLDWQIYHKSILIEQQKWSLALDRIFEAWLEEYGKLNFIKIDSLEWSWIYPSIAEHSDPYKQSHADTVALQAKTTTLAKIYAEKGESWEQAMLQLQREIEVCHAVGIKHPCEVDASNSENGEADE